MGDVNTFRLSEIEKEGLFILRDECKKFELAEIMDLGKRGDG